MSSKQNLKMPFTENKPSSSFVQEISLHSQSKPNKNPFVFNPFLQNKKITQLNVIDNSVQQNQNKTQLLNNTPSISPIPSKNISNVNSSGVIKIKIYKSHIKSHRTGFQEEIGESAKLKLEQKTELKNEKINFTPMPPGTPAIPEISISANKSNEYKKLIKKIAMQLKRKIRPRTRGHFYQKIIRNEKYFNIVKRIAQSIKIKLGIHPPTNGAFYAFMKKEEEMKLKQAKEEKYKILIKRISSQLKKRIKLPTCKIIKIYEPYVILIKRLAHALKKSMKTSVSNSNSNTNDNNTNNEIEINDNKMDIEPTNCDCECDKYLNDKKIQNCVIVEKNEEKMDIEMTKEEENLNSMQILTEVKKETKEENNDIKSLSYEQKEAWISSEKKIDNNKDNNYTFSKMEVIDNELPISSSQKKLPEFNPENLNQESDADNKEIKKENEYLLYGIKDESQINNNINHDVIKEKEIKCEDKEKVEEEKDEVKAKEKIEYTEPKKMEIDKDKNKEEDEEKIKYIKSLSKSAKSKGLIFKFSLMKKDNLFQIDDYRKIANKSHTKINSNLNLENLHDMLKAISNKEVKEDSSENTNLSLQDIEVTKSNFINKFKNFLEQENIQIKNNFPVSTNEKHILYFQQSNFWYLIMTYLIYTKSNLSLYNILYLLEQFESWAQDKNMEIFYSLKEKIKEYVYSTISKEVLEQFLFMNKLENLDKIFEKIELSVKFNEKSDKFRNEFKEIKVENICYSCDNNKKCECDLCINDEACIKKVCDLNKSRMEIVNNSNIDIMKKEFTPEEIRQSLIKKNNSTIVFHNNEELFYKGNSPKKNNTIFSKSKTILEDIGNFQFIHVPQVQQVTDPLTSEKKRQIESIDIELNKKEEAEEKDLIKNNNNNNANDSSLKEIDIIPMENFSQKTFKNISKSPNKVEKGKEEEKNKSEEKDMKESREEEESSDEDTKNMKIEKKSRNRKSRKNKKKKDTTKIKEAKENNEAKKEDKSVQKKRKSTNHNSIRKNKSKNCDKNEEKENNNESEEMLMGTRSEKKLEETESINNSKRKKSKTPNKKKTKKH